MDRQPQRLDRGGSIMPRFFSRPPRQTIPEPADGWYSLHGRAAGLALAAALVLAVLLVLLVVLLPVL
jgi:hypothetical protein